jgi:hypothetical protein
MSTMGMVTMEINCDLASWVSGDLPKAICQEGRQLVYLVRVILSKLAVPSMATAFLAVNVYGQTAERT